MELEVVSKLAILLQAASTMPEEASKETGPTSSLLGVNKGRSPGGTSPISPTSPASPSSPINNAISNRANRALLLENVLLALATVSSLKEEPRKQIIDANLLPRIVSLLAHPDPRIQASACQCTMSLSRSVKNLRTSLVDAGVAEPLFKLLETGDARAQVSASATICNIVLDFSPMKKVGFFEQGVIDPPVPNFPDNPTDGPRIRRHPAPRPPHHFPRLEPPPQRHLGHQKPLLPRSLGTETFGNGGTHMGPLDKLAPGSGTLDSGASHQFTSEPRVWQRTGYRTSVCGTRRRDV